MALNPASAKITHIVDDYADMIIILKNSGAKFAPWDAPGLANNRNQINNFTAGFDHLDTSELDFLDNDDLEDSVSVGTITSTEGAIVETPPMQCEVHYLVSSRHLAVASPTLDMLLSSRNWSEAGDGLHHVEFEGWDSNALLVFLQALHNLNLKVPDRISLETLAKIAVLADYYDCRVVLRMHAKNWLRNLEPLRVPTRFSRDLILWLCVAWTFQIPEKLSQAARVAIKEWTKDIPILGLPATKWADKIIEARKSVIESVLSNLQDLLQEYRSLDYTCTHSSSFNCGSIMYGALTKEMDIAGLLPLPVVPFPGLSISVLDGKLRRMRSPLGAIGSAYGQNLCTFTGRISALRDEINNSVEDFKIEDV